MKVVVWWILLVMYAAGVLVGVQIGYERGFDAGVCEERIMTVERSDCSCLGNCCAEHHRRIHR